MIYLYLIDIDHLDHYSYEPDDIIDTDHTTTSQQQTYYWWAVILISIATESIHSLGHLVVIISINRIRSETIFLIILTLVFLLSITSNFQIHTRFTLSFLNVFRYLNEAILVLHYGYFHSCTIPLSRSSYIRQQQQPISLVLYRIDSDLNPDIHFYHCFRVLIYQTILFRFGSWFALLLRANGDRIFHHHRLWITGKSSSSTNQSYLDHYEWSTTTATAATRHSYHHDQQTEQQQQQQEPSPSTSTESTVSDLSAKLSSSPSSLDGQINNHSDDDEKLEFRL